MAIIKAPFNFIPITENILYPNWADFISHDVPFEDGESGTIVLTIEACSPIFVRDGNLSSENNETNFSNFNGQYFIPGTSIKGMLRSIVEILSFSKLSIFNDDRYAVRDLSSADNFYMKEMKKDIYCGWLEKTVDGTFRILDCGIPGRLSHKVIEKQFPDSEMAKHFRGEQTENTKSKYDNKKDDCKSAKYKYDLFSEIGLKKAKFNCVGKDKANRKIYEFGDDKEGTIVFTGQPSKRVENGRNSEGKLYEFIFLTPDENIYLDIDKSVMNDFKFAYFDHDEKKQSIDWKYWWKEKLMKNGKRIPVFFKKKNGKVCHLGLSYLYKLPYEYRIGDYLNFQKYPKMDLAECIFGRIEDDKGEGMSLKGRVHVGHAFLQNEPKLLRPRSEVLSSPKASYYPIYTTQSAGSNGKVSKFNTFMDKNGVSISGRKRYPVRKGSSVIENHNPANDNVSTRFTPLTTGSKFQCKIYYHNLRKVELGALLSAITFHNAPNCFHNIGMGKPLGYGKVKISINNNETLDSINCMAAFEQLMQVHTKDKWLKSPQIRELISMATDPYTNEHLSYMNLEEFRTAKNQKEFLLPYSKLINNYNELAQLSIQDTSNLIVQDVTELTEKLRKLKESIYIKLENIRLEKEKKREKEEERKIEQEKKEEERRIEQEKREEKRAKALKEGLQVENAGGDFEKIVKSVNKYLDAIKPNSIPESDIEKLKQILKENISLAGESGRKRNIWKKDLKKHLSKWVGEEKAEAWTIEMLQQ